jgi:putative hydrolase of the HAD superfamily
MPNLCVVFDLDDTLYAERDFAVSAFGEMGRWAEANHGIAGLAHDLAALLDQGHLGQIFSMALKARHPGHSAADLDALRRVYLSHAPEFLSLFEDASRALDRLSQRADVKLGLITDGTANVQAAKIKALGIGHRFGHAILTGALGSKPGDRAFHKPHPLAFERMQAALAEPGDRLVYVGDNPAKDFQAPNRMGWTTVQVDRPSQRPFNIHRGAAALPDGAAHHVIGSLDGLPLLLGAAR